MKIILFIIGLFILYAQYHHVYIHGYAADELTYILTGVGVVAILMSIAKVRPLE
jgi:hypothetical protein